MQHLAEACALLAERETVLTVEGGITKANVATLGVDLVVTRPRDDCRGDVRRLTDAHLCEHRLASDPAARRIRAAGPALVSACATGAAPSANASSDLAR